MKYNFDKEINRLGTNCVKWDGMEEVFGREDVLPLWVADMDFKSPNPVRLALKSIVEHGVFGYAVKPNSLDNAIIEWFKKRHDWIIEKEWIDFAPGVVSGLNVAVNGLTHPGDKVIIQTPVYYPFKEVIEGNGCQVVTNPLKRSGKTYIMDFEDLEEKAKDPAVRLLILCSPHNPVGRVWTKDELRKVGDICSKNGVVVLSDEIHCDLVYSERKHIPFASISEVNKMISLTFVSPSKTFNLAGLHHSHVVVPNERIRDIYRQMLRRHHLESMNPFGIAGTEAAYLDGEQFLDELLVYLQGNLDYVTKFVNEKLAGIEVVKPEGTYLVWLDCRELGIDWERMDDFFLNQAKVALDHGHWFGKEGNGYMRINIACTRSLLEKALKQIEFAMQDIINWSGLDNL